MPRGLHCVSDLIVFLIKPHSREVSHSWHASEHLCSMALEIVHLIVRASAVPCKVRRCINCRPNMEQVSSFHAYWYFSSKPVSLPAACTRLECICTPDCCSAIWPLLGGFILQ